MIVTSTYSTQLRAKMTPADWAAIRKAGAGEVRFGRGYRGAFIATVTVAGASVVGTDQGSPRAAFDKALRELGHVPASLLDGPAGGPAA